MSTGSRAYRMAAGEGKAIREHIEALIPVEERKAESEMMIRQKAFEQEITQAEKMGLLSQKLSGRQAQPVFAPPPLVTDKGEQPNYTILIILGIAAVLFFKKGKLW